MSTLAFGSYIPGKSAVHSLNAQVKIILACAISLGAFFVEGWLGLGALCALVLAGYAAARLPLGCALGGLRPVALILAVTVLCNALTRTELLGARAAAPGALGMGSFVELGGGWCLSADGVLVGCFFALRIAVLVAACCLLSFTSSATALMSGLRSLLGPLGRCGLPVDDLCMVASMALRFLPLVFEELSSARRAREARGLCFEGAGPVAAARAWASVLVPAFTGLFRRADRLALAMDARAYGSGPRSSLTARTLTARDVAVLCIALAAVLCVAVLL